MNEQSPLRLAMLGVLVVGMFTSLFARMWYLQVVEEQRVEAQTQAAENLTRKVFIDAPRGRVLDRNGNVLIDNRLVNEVVIDKFEFREAIPSESGQRDFAIKLATEISAAGRLIKAADIEAALNDQKYGPFDLVPIATDVPERFSILIGERAHEFPGVDIQKTTVRFYPYGTRAAHLLGYVGPISEDRYQALRTSPKLYRRTDEIGEAGVEASLEDILRGVPGEIVIEIDSLGNRIGEPLSERDPVPGNDVQLTIDINLQALVEDELERGVRNARERLDDTDEDNPVEYKAPGGAMVLLDPDGSRVLAMASYPTYDQRFFLQTVRPETEFAVLRDDPAAPLLDRASAGNYAPGSTFKLITAYAAMDSGLLGDRGFLKLNQFLVDEGVWKVGGDDCFGPGCTIENAGQKPLGDVDIRLAIAESSNIYFGQLGFQFQVRQGFTADQLLDVAKDFGYVSRPDAITGAITGSIPPPETAGAAANLAVGQGLMIATPLQIANSYAAIANGGTVYSPMLAEAAIDQATEEIVIDYQPREINTLYMPEEFYEPLITGLIGVTTDEDGTAYEAFQNFPLDRFLVLGKTGTVENPPRQDNAAFAAFGPWPNPQYAAVTYIEQAGLGGEAAAPVVAAVFERIANGDIDIVPTEAEVDDLVSEAQALAEEERLQSEREAQLEAERAAASDGDDGSFAVLVPGGDDIEDRAGESGTGETDAGTGESGSAGSEAPVAGDATGLAPEEDDEEQDP
ncbi:MAG: penicillin-binding transpeptidase domain-containing protein [Actinomycetota bacterium]